MPIIPISEFPQVARSGRVSQWAPQMDELAELLKMDNFGAGNAVSFPDIKKDDLSALVTSLRKEAKNVGRKVNCVFVATAGTTPETGTVFAKDNGAADDESDSAKTIRKSVSTKSK